MLTPFTLLILATAADAARPIQLDAVTIDNARMLSAKSVVVAFVIGKPLDRQHGVTDALSRCDDLGKNIAVDELVR